MSKKEDIFNNIDRYSAQDLADYITDGVFSLEELRTETHQTINEDIINEVERLINSVAPTETAKTTTWAEVDKESIEELEVFIANNPDDYYIREAERLLEALYNRDRIGLDAEELINRINEIVTANLGEDEDKEIASVITDFLVSKRISHEDLISLIRFDNNLLGVGTINKLKEAGRLNLEDLKSAGIDVQFIKKLNDGAQTESFDSPHPLDRINKVCTEVYFWGIPSSGKTCALGAIMSVANNGTVAKSMSKNKKCQGYGYMVRLSALFRSNGKVGVLPAGTATTDTYEMGFDLEDENGASHPITCIDLAGELLRCMYKSSAGEPMDDDERQALQTLTTVLVDNRTKNRKIHFFVLEYGGENRQYEGLRQSAYLESALEYIEDTKIFEKDTDAIYILLTKVDKTHLLGQDLVNALSKYVIENYMGFYNGLERICRENEINGGKVECLPFSLGEVCFRRYCKFNAAPAANVVKKLLIRSKGFKHRKTDFLKK